MPVLGIAEHPSFAEAVLVGKFAEANVANFIDLLVYMVGDVDLFAAGTFVPVLAGIATPLGAKVVLMEHENIAAIASFVVIFIQVAGQIVFFSAGTFVPVGRLVRIPRFTEAMLVWRQRGRGYGGRGCTGGWHRRRIGTGNGSVAWME